MNKHFVFHLSATLLLLGAAETQASQTPSGEARALCIAAKYKEAQHHDAEAFQLLRRAADMDYAPAEYALSAIYQTGKCVEKDAEKAAELLRRAAAHGHAGAQQIIRKSEKAEAAHQAEEANKTPSPTNAFEEYSRKAADGDAHAQYKLGECYEKGYGVAPNATQAVAYYLQAAENNLAEAMLQLGRCCEFGRGTPRDLPKAVKWYFKAASQNNAEAQYELGECYRLSKGVSMDRALALHWYSKAAAQNHAGGIYGVGRCTEDAPGVPENILRAACEYRRASHLGNPYAKYQLGCLYMKGECVGEDKREANLLFQEAVELLQAMANVGDARAQTSLGTCYERNQGVDQNAGLAVKYYRMAADQNYARGQYNLGTCYQEGIGVTQDNVQAEKHFRNAAQQGDVMALTSLGNLLRLQKDTQKEAFLSYESAAKQGYAQAQYNLGRCYEKGLGTTKDSKAAATWYTKAAAQGHAKAKQALENAAKQAPQKP